MTGPIDPTETVTPTTPPTEPSSNHVSEPTNNHVSEPASAPRSVGVRHVVGAVLAGVLLVASGVFLVTATGDRDDDSA